MDKKISFRLYENKDLEKVLELWEKFSGWGGITKKDFNSWYFHAPDGASIIVVATDENDEVAGQLIFSPASLYVTGENVKSLRLSSPVLNAKMRQADIKSYDHPVFGMLRYGMKIAREQDFKIVYTFPAVGWTEVLKLFPAYGLPNVEISTFDCFNISLKNTDTFKIPPAELLVTELKKSFNENYSALWNEAAVNLPIECGLIRDANCLNWKLGNRKVFEIRETNDKKNLKGYVAINETTGLLVDMLARTKKDLEMILLSTVHALHHINPCRMDVSINELKGMKTPLLESVLSKVPYNLNNFKFAFACFLLDNQISQERIKTTHWYMMPND